MKKYIEIYYDIKSKIDSGELKYGDKLPSIRKASKLYRVSITTVQNAYFDLCADGLVVSSDKSGYYVTQRKIQKVIDKAADNTNIIKYDFTGGLADADVFDMSLWQRYIKSALRQEKRLLSYAQPQGEYDLREAICKYIYEKRNIIASPERIVIGAGVQSLLHILCALIDKSSTVSFPDKSFTQGISLFSNYGFEVHTRDKNADIIYVSPSHMTRWGDVMPIKRRLELVEYSNINNSLVIEDDYENEFQYNTKPTPSLYALGKGNIVYIGSFSNMLLPGIRISFMVLTNELVEKFREQEYMFSQTASLTEQIALCSYIRDGHIYSQTRKIRRLYTAKTRTFYNLVKEKIPALEAKISENSLQVIIKTHKNNSYDEFETLGIKLYIADGNTLLLSPAGVPSSDFEAVVDLLKINIFSKHLY